MVVPVPQYAAARKKFPLEQANEAIKASLEVGRSDEGKIFLQG